MGATSCTKSGPEAALTAAQTNNAEDKARRAAIPSDFNRLLHGGPRSGCACEDTNAGLADAPSTAKESYMQLPKASCYLVPAVLVGALALFAADVSTDYDHHADFAKYHTYSWLGVKAGNSLWQDRIQSAVDKDLQAKGWQRVRSGGDAVVSAFGRTSEQQTLETYYNGFPGWGWRGWGGMGTATTTAVPRSEEHTSELQSP